MIDDVVSRCLSLSHWCLYGFISLDSNINHLLKFLHIVMSFGVEVSHNSNRAAICSWIGSLLGEFRLDLIFILWTSLAYVDTWQNMGSMIIQEVIRLIVNLGPGWSISSHSLLVIRRVLSDLIIQICYFINTKAIYLLIWILFISIWALIDCVSLMLFKFFSRSYTKRTLC